MSRSTTIPLNKGMFPFGPSDSNKPKDNITKASNAVAMPKTTPKAKGFARPRYTTGNAERTEERQEDREEETGYTETRTRTRAGKATTTTQVGEVEEGSSEPMGVSKMPGVERTDPSGGGNENKAAGGRTVKSRKATKRSRDDNDEEADTGRPLVYRRTKVARRN